MWISKRKLCKLRQESYELGLVVRKELDEKLERMEQTKRGFITGLPRALQEADDILRGKT